MRILVVEDEHKVASFIQRGLEAEHYAIDVVADGEAALIRAMHGEYDLMILDIMLPKRDGLAVLRELRARNLRLPVLLLTARDTIADKVAGLDSGADDYLTKPFAFDELLARLRALGRRSGTALTSPTLRFADVEMDRVRHRAARAGRPLELTAREFRLLEYFLTRPDKVVTRTELLEKVWDMSFDPESNVVDVHVSNLRKKLEDGGAARLIQTVRGVGFALRQDA